VQVEGRPDGMVRDLTWRVHWKKVFLWLPMAGCLTWGLVYERTHNHSVLIITHIDGSDSCAWGDHLRCKMPTQARLDPLSCT
jgi:hypothetical protein